ncbi:MAG: hypothetical protein HY711_07820 [Candidatus Melainabacteria bacterium]|nr:hypothetical protein [Candidatus Melainabacteria bacterium]
MIDSMAHIACVYTKLGCYWRAEPIFKKLLGVPEKKPAAYCPAVANAFRNYSAVLRRIKREQEAVNFETLNEVLASQSNSEMRK